MTVDSSTAPIHITAQNLGKRFTREWIFRKLDFTFTGGNVYAITGPNGSGKSTLLQLLWGQMPPSSGRLTYSDHTGALESETIFRRLTIATPYMDLVDELTLLELLRFHFSLKTARHNMSLQEMLEKMQLAHVQNQQIANFSSGMKQRVKLALAFFTHADMVFLDEPGTNLDKPSFDWYLSHLRALPSGCLIVIASNQPAEYPENAQKIDILKYK